MFVVNENIINDDLISVTPGVDMIIGCGYTEVVTSVILYAVEGSQMLRRSLSTEVSIGFRYSYRTYVEKGQDAHGCKMYRCIGVISQINFPINLTVNFGGCTTGTCIYLYRNVQYLLEYFSVQYYCYSKCTVFTRVCFSTVLLLQQMYSIY